MNAVDEVMQELLQVKQAEVQRFKTLENLFAHLQRASDQSTLPAAAQQSKLNATQLPGSRLGK
jgi:hypothetical protein